MSTSLYVLMFLCFCAMSYFAWLFIHEASHILAAHCLFGVKNWSIKLLPEKHGDTIWWGSCKYQPEFQPMSSELAQVALAPRIPNLIACALLPLAPIFSFPFSVFWVIFFGAGLIDLLVGSFGISEYSDLRKAAAGLSIDPNFIRFIGLFCLFCSVISTIYGFFLAYRCF